MNILNDMGQVYGPDNGYKAHPLLGKTVETGNAGAPPPTAPKIMRFDAQGNPVQ